MKRSDKTSPANKAKVLVIDDDEEWLDYAKTSLSTDFSVFTAQGGKDGLERAATIRPDAILLDVMMPGGADGFSVFCQLRLNAGTKSIPVIMFTQINQITGLDFGTEGMKQYLGSGPVAFLEKPLTPQRLTAEVHKAIAASV